MSYCCTWYMVDSVALLILVIHINIFSTTKKSTAYETYANGKAKFPLNVGIPKIPIRNFQVQLDMGAFLNTESSKLLAKPEKNNYGGDLGPRSASGRPTRMFGSKRRESESSTDIDRQNQLLRHEF